MMASTRVLAPHPVSNLRRIERVPRADETRAEKRLRLQLDADHEFHQRFWHKNNTDFKQAREAFLEEHREDMSAGRLPAHLMAEFYCSFLEAHREDHITYNLEWWGRAARQIPLYVHAYVSRFFTFSWLTLQPQHSELQEGPSSQPVSCEHCGACG